MELETNKVKVSRFKSKKFWLKAVGLLVAISIIYGMGESSASVKIDGEKVTYDELVSEIKDKEKEIKSVDKELDKIESEYKDKDAEFKEALKVVENKKSIEDEIAKLNVDIEGKKGEIAKLDTDIAAKNNELASITGVIKEKKDAPKVLSAGFFTVGKDIPAGRYKVVPNGGNGNFFVNGGASVNIMLGKGEYYEEEYVFTANEGDEIELTLSAKFIPVE